MLFGKKKYMSSILSVDRSEINSCGLNLLIFNNLTGRLLHVHIVWAIEKKREYVRVCVCSISMG